MQPCVYATLLRNPIDRVVSQSYFIRNGPGHPRHAEVMARGATLLDYLRNGVNPQADNGQVRALAEQGGGTKVDLSFGGCTSDMLATARRNLTELYALVGITERFDEFLVRMRDALGWRDIHYQRRKVTQARPAVAMLSTEEHDAVQACNRLDLELYAAAEQMVNAARERQRIWFPAQVAWFQWRNRRGQVASPRPGHRRNAGQDSPAPRGARLSASDRDER